MHTARTLHAHCTHTFADTQQALNLEPGYGEAFGRKGLAHSALNQHTKARDCFKKALQLTLRIGDNAHCTHTARTLHAHCTHTARTLHAHCTHTARTLHEHCTHTARTLHAHCTHTARTLHAHCTNTARTLHEHCMHTARTLHEHCTNTARTLHAHGPTGIHCVLTLTQFLIILCFG